ncbi:shikimate 5-dehydrogenase [Propioniciclava soli]|uniref:Shikimate 5-dehydrogenase n=1 Tax=Propioniciclava soli TaxID=2775081 RepID=A0ABZ3C7H1_9ACTN|nr:shikimate 5-dehydrogenase [Propioniciclava soli]
MRTIAGDLTKDTQLCISLAARPGNTGTRFHNFLYDALGLDFVYKAFTTTDITAAIAGVRGLGIRGCAVSMPWKSDVIALIDEMEPSAAAIDSVNTIVNTDGHLVAYNTDYLAIEHLLAQYDVPTQGEVAVLGSGGMAKATVAACANNGYTGMVVARNETTGRALADQYGFEWAAELGARRPHTLINCTPVGMEGGPDADALPVSLAAVDAAGVVFDVVPRPARTPLVRAGEARGTVTITGAEVMSLQALEQFVLYTGVRPDDALVAEATAYSRHS